MRPLNDAERERGAAWHVEGNSLHPVEPGSGARVGDASYKLDEVFDGSRATREVYETAAQGLIEQVISGFNSTVFAYGQTSSGKTHTMKVGELERREQAYLALHCRAASGLARMTCSCFDLFGMTWRCRTPGLQGDGREDGIIPLAVREIFDRIAGCQDREFLVRVSYMEVRRPIYWLGLTAARAAAAWCSAGAHVDMAS